MIGDAEFRSLLSASLSWDIDVDSYEDVEKLVKESVAAADAEEAAIRAIAAIHRDEMAPDAPVAHEIYVAKLLDEARVLRPSNTKRSLACTSLATQAASDLSSHAPAMRATRGAVWREHAETLSLLGRHAEALGAIAQAANDLEDGENTYEANKLAITRATVLGAMGRGFEEIFRIRAAAAFFKEIDDVEQYRNTRMVEAMILYRDRRFDEMVLLYLQLYNELASADASQIDAADEPNRLATLAMLSNNIGHGLRALGNLTDARVYLERAEQMYSTLGYKANALKASWGLAKIARATGAFDDALRMLADISRQFSSIGYEVDAGLVQLDRAAVFHDIDGWVECAAICRMLARQFSEAGMPRATVEALAFLRDCVERRVVTNDSFEYVNAFVSKARNDHSAVFVAPSVF